ncbi:unnamed protein product [Sphagnum compactum]
MSAAVSPAPFERSRNRGSNLNAVPQKANDLNLTLGGIDLNNSGSVLVRAEKKLLTVLFPDGRAFTLKAETVEDVDEWKEALERALEAAPNAALVVGHETAFRNDSHDAFEGFADHGRDRRPVKSLVVGKPISLALEDIDGSPSFLEKALCFIYITLTDVPTIVCSLLEDVLAETNKIVHHYPALVLPFSSQV